MSEKYSMDKFILDIDRISSGEAIVWSDKDCDGEYRELVKIAQLLTQADYTRESKNVAEKLLARAKLSGELDDDDLDMVAGGVNPAADPGIKNSENR